MLTRIFNSQTGMRALAPVHTGAMHRCPDKNAAAKKNPDCQGGPGCCLAGGAAFHTAPLHRRHIAGT